MTTALSQLRFRVSALTSTKRRRVRQRKLTPDARSLSLQRATEGLPDAPKAPRSYQGRLQGTARKRPLQIYYYQYQYICDDVHSSLPSFTSVQSLNLPQCPRNSLLFKAVLFALPEVGPALITTTRPDSRQASTRVPNLKAAVHRLPAAPLASACARKTHRRHPATSGPE